MVKNPPTKQEMWVRSLRWEDPLLKEMASILAWEMPWTRNSGGPQSVGSQKRQSHSLLTEQHQVSLVVCGFSLQLQCLGLVAPQHVGS